MKIHEHSLQHAFLAACSITLCAAGAWAQDTELLSSSQGLPSDGPNEDPSVSANGRFVAWVSRATNLVSGDTNTSPDVVLLDRESGQLELVSRTSQGVAANSSSFHPRLSADGRLLVFATNAVDMAGGGGRGVWLYDRVQGTHTRISSTAVVGTDAEPCISTSGRWIAYVTVASLLPQDTNAAADVYRYDRVTGATDLVTRDANGVQTAWGCSQPTISADGRFVALQARPNDGAWGAEFATSTHVWVKDMQTGSLEAASTTPNGEPANSTCRDPHMSADGRWVAFLTGSSNLITTAGVQQVAVKDRLTGQVVLASANNGGAPGDNYSWDPFIGPDGRYVGFRSASTNLPGGFTQGYYNIWMRDLVDQTTFLVSRSSASTGQVRGDRDSVDGAASVSGRYVAFSSDATNLVVGDTNLKRDIFVRDLFGDLTRSFGWSPEQSTGCLPHIESLGSPSASAGSGFDIRLEDVRGTQPGILIYSTAGPSAVPLFGSFLYVAPPIVRTPPQQSGGTSGMCDGSFVFDFNTWVTTGPDANLTAGTTVWAQYWSRDPGDPDGAHLSDALSFQLLP